MKRIVLLFVFLYCSSLAQDNETRDIQDLLDTRASAETVLQGLAEVINLDARPCGIFQWKYMSWPQVAICGVTSLTPKEVKEKAVSFMIIEKNASLDKLLWYDISETYRIQSGNFSLTDGDYIVSHDPESGSAVLFFSPYQIMGYNLEEFFKTGELVNKKQIKSLIPEIEEIVFYSFGVQSKDFVDCDGFSELPNFDQTKRICAQTVLTLDDVKNMLEAFFTKVISVQPAFRPISDEIHYFNWITLDDGVYLDFAFDVVPFTLRFIEGTDNKLNTLVLYHPVLE